LLQLLAVALGEQRGRVRPRVADEPGRFREPPARQHRRQGRLRRQRRAQAAQHRGVRDVLVQAPLDPGGRAGADGSVGGRVVRRGRSSLASPAAVAREPRLTAAAPLSSPLMTGSWVLLVVAGLLEVGWAVGLKYTDGFNFRARPVPCTLTLTAMVASMYMLSVA